MSFLDSIFGGESTKGIKFQKAENDRKREQIDLNRDAALDSVNNIIPGGIDALNQGYNSAINVQKQGPQAQISELQRTSQRAQENLLGGMNAFQSAILGMPTGLQGNYYNNQLGMKPISLSESGNTTGKEVFQNIGRPEFLSQPTQADTASRALAGSAALNIDPGTTTNAQIVEQLYQNGQISEYDYTRMKESFGNSGSGSGVAWGQGRPASEMIGWLPDDLHPRFRQTNQNIFNAIEQYNPAYGGA